MPYTVKKLTSSDVDLARQLFWFYQVDDGIVEPVVPAKEYLHKMLLKNSFHVIVALDGETLIGGLTAYELEMYKEEITEMFLYEIGVEPAYRKMGVAGALIESLKDICRKKRIKEMYVGTSTDNEAAMKLYRSTGGEADVKIAWFVYTIN